MNRHFVLVGSLVAGLLVASAASAQVSVTIYPAIGPSPNAPTYNPASYAAFAANAVSALQAAATFPGSPLAPGGTAGTPGYYSPGGSSITSNISNFIATPFNSWLGVTPPSGAFAGEFGNAVYFTASFTSNGTPFALSDVQFNIDINGSTVSGGPQLLSSANNNNQYGGGFIGAIDVNGNGFYDPGIDTLVDSIGGVDPDTTLVDFLWTVGISGFELPVGGGTPQQQIQAAIDAFVAANGPNALIEAQYSFLSGLGVNANNGAVNATVPEPASMAVLGLGVVGLLGYTYRRRKQVVPVAC
ncbi:MAG: PEP-CTERM sorting domain-containing protein [Planctomycetes bacterium]|nr:PEP-CTERM sorting domain-containing protein [Planctomycetota bacterium]